jgi:Ca2+-binding RTX toxin-like protein
MPTGSTSTSSTSRGRRLRSTWWPSARAVTILVLLVAALVLPPTAASADANDTASGSGTIGSDQWHCPTSATQTFQFSATGTGTPAASGTFSFSCSWTDGQPPVTWGGAVECLQFRNGTVVIGGAVTSTNVSAFTIGEPLHFAVIDGGVGSGDKISDLYVGSSCDQTPAQYEIVGEITVYKSPQCSDGLDNDADGSTDFPADPGCTDATDDTESPNPPPPAQCTDGLDNDADGSTDFPADPGCTDATDDTESPNPPNAPTCEGRTATVYVAAGRIVGGPDSGQPYTGTLRGTDGADVINGTTGADTITSGGGTDTVCALGGMDNVSGEADADRLIGGVGNDRLSGGTGADTLQGRAGNDTLTGGEGADRFVGGPGTDTASDFNRTQGDTRTSIP